MADGYAVKELLKIASLLYSAMKTNQLDRVTLCNIETNSTLLSDVCLQDSSGDLSSSAMEISSKVGPVSTMI